ncbi:putative Acyltransferase [Beijerinckiaceae bacterium RH AL1]|nr:acyltransferase [Beijerinckiaceae bacterium]VVB44147.1 putative Acyltransferase [Beijerinckiaceae bacterium RH CH11]VVB44174.1 putative Acyltransferase [Beijerinckiaceae bacterium RH AL8]VVC54193.1 putative Acyltransferase [Beijerinckiaceae bacterium RH AL1]
MRSDPSSKPATPLSLRSINGWRGPGALAIAFAHFAVASELVTYRRLEPIALLVDMFFVFSGIVIAQVYSEKLANARAIPEYIVRRFGRIWPLQAATLALLVGYELLKLVLQAGFGRQFSTAPFSHEGYNLLSAIPTNLLLIQAIGLHDRETWNFPSWSLSVEFVTYVMFAAFCLIGPAWRRAAAVITIAISLAVLIFVAPYHMRSTFDYGLFRCFAGFFAGTLCYEAACRWLRPNWRMPTLMQLGALALVIVWMTFSSWGLLVFAAPFVFCLFVLAYASEQGLVSRFLVTKPMQFLAELSFAIYMVHALVLIFFLAGMHALARATGQPLFQMMVNPLAGRPGAPATVEVLHIANPALLWLCAILYLVTVVALAYAAYLWIEVPGRAFFGRIAKRIDRKRLEGKRLEPKLMPTNPSSAVPLMRDPLEPAP